MPFTVWCAACGRGWNRSPADLIRKGWHVKRVDRMQEIWTCRDCKYQEGTHYTFRRAVTMAPYYARMGTSFQAVRALHVREGRAERNRLQNRAA